ncbi:MAG TPA: hypothetical protein VIT89_04340 [Solirubrobacterales bacterium]
MAYRDRDLLENVAEQPPPKPSADKRPPLLRSLRRAVRDAIMRQVSTKR